MRWLDGMHEVTRRKMNELSEIVKKRADQKTYPSCHHEGVNADLMDTMMKQGKRKIQKITLTIFTVYTLQRHNPCENENGNRDISNFISLARRCTKQLMKMWPKHKIKYGFKGRKSPGR